jgi:hypothetical protein
MRECLYYEATKELKEEETQELEGEPGESKLDAWCRREVGFRYSEIRKHHRMVQSWMQEKEETLSLGDVAEAVGVCRVVSRVATMAERAMLAYQSTRLRYFLARNPEMLWRVCGGLRSCREEDFGSLLDKMASLARTRREARERRNYPARKGYMGSGGRKRASERFLKELKAAEGLKAAMEEFGAEFGPGNGDVRWWIRNVELSDDNETVWLGDFLVGVGQSKTPCCYEVGNRNNWSLSEVYVHPYVNGNPPTSICLGPENARFYNLLEQGLAAEAFDVVQGVMTHYVPEGSPYTELKSWYREEEECARCGFAVAPDDLFACDSCGEYVCESCYRGSDLCLDCGIACEECYEVVPQEDVFSCDDCGVCICSDCVVNHEGEFLCPDCERDRAAKEEAEEFETEDEERARESA